MQGAVAVPDTEVQVMARSGPGVGGVVAMQEFQQMQQLETALLILEAEAAHQETLG
jgi:hypothetical protein